MTAKVVNEAAGYGCRNPVSQGGCSGQEETHPTVVFVGACGSPEDYDAPGHLGKIPIT